MKKKIREFNDYVLNNPFVKKDSFKIIFMKAAYICYKFIRQRVFFFIPLNSSQKIMWESSIDQMDWDGLNSATFTKDNKEPYFNMKFILASEIISKEDIESLRSKLKTIKQKHSSKFGYNKLNQKFDFWDRFENRSASQNLGYITIKAKSKLYKYATHLHFELHNISDSFCRLDVKIFPNKTIRTNLNTLAITHLDSKTCTHIDEFKQWHQFRNLGKQTIPGRIQKSNIIKSIIEDIKWNIIKEIQDSTNSFLFTSCLQGIPSTTVFSTNIEGNKNIDFWYSIGIIWLYCDYLPRYDACISWEHDTNAFYIYAPRDDNKLNHYDIHNIVNEYLTIDSLFVMIRKKIGNFYSVFTKYRIKKSQTILKCKQKFDYETYHDERFLNEYVYEFQKSNFNEYHSLHRKSPPIILLKYKNLNREIKQIKQLYYNSKKQFDHNISYLYSIENHRLQRVTLYISIISAIVATLALIGTDNFSIYLISSLKEIFYFIQNLLKNV